MVSDNKKIAKNTMMLYIRMLLIMAVSLYTSRIILQVLGIDDYGIYNLIAGFVTFLVFISNSLVSAMQRYFNMALGQNNPQRYKEVFSMSLNILFLFSILIVVVGETIGLWFVHNHLNIPENRFDAAMWVYHISLLTFVANTLRTPFHASIIAHEKMSFYAYISIFEVILRLAMVFLLVWVPFDHLIMYALLYLCVIICVDILYITYCTRRFQVCHYTFRKDLKLFKELLGFSGWSLLGQSAVVVKNQGEAIFINKFFSVAANAALGIAAQVTNAIEMFVTNFQTAFTPQLTQTYAAGNIEQHHNLLFRSAKFSYYLLLVMLLPLCFNIDIILSLWLEEVPEHTSRFVTFILISYLFNALSTPFYTSILASGNVKYYQITVGITFVLGLAFIYLILWLGMPPYSVSIVAIFIQIALLAIRIIFCKKYVGISICIFIRSVILPIIICTILSVTITFVLSLFAEGTIASLLTLAVDAFVVLGIVFVIGITKAERAFVLKMINKKNK